MAKWSAWGSRLQSVLRIAAALMFMLAGTIKLLGFPDGLFTRPVAFLLAGEMAVAYFQVHLPRGFWPTMNGGMAAALYCFVWLCFSAAGAGPWSLDARRGKQPTSA
jgi:putative oxidoreductase